jgi:hypothetical protein
MIRALAVLMLFVGACASAQPAPQARIETNRVFMPGEPSIRIRVPEGASYAGAERFELYGVADCEIHVFVEADADKRVRRLYWVQFEAYLPSRPDHRYDYSGDGNRPMDLWGGRAWVRPGIILTGRASRAGSDTERVRSILRRAGYVEPQDFAHARFVRLLDDPDGTGRGRRELMLIYAEDMASNGATVDDVLDDGQPNARWAPLAEALIGRAQAAFAVEIR